MKLASFGFHHTLLPFGDLSGSGKTRVEVRHRSCSPYKQVQEGRFSAGLDVCKPRRDEARPRPAPALLAMAEARLEEDEEELREPREAAFRRTCRPQSASTDHTERHKPDRRSSSAVELIFMFYVATSTRTNSLSDHPRDRRRPEITILSAEPLPITPWFPGTPAGFAPSTHSSQSIWSGNISPSAQPPPSYDQVIKEKTQEQVNPPVRSTTTAATQTDLDLRAVDYDPGLNVMSKALEKKGFNLRRPPKPPRPVFPLEVKPVPSSKTVTPDNSLREKLSEECAETDTCQVTAKNRPFDLGCHLLLDSNTASPEQSLVQPDPCLISLDSPTELNEFSIPSSDTSASCLVGEERKHPVPRPRLKPPTSKEVKVQTLVRLKDDGEKAQLIFNSGEVYTGRYLQELLDIFGPEDQCFPTCHSDPSEQGDQREDIMSTLRAKIKAFEKQSTVSSEDTEIKKPEPRPRVQQPKPAVMGTKPSLAPKPSSKNFWEGGSPAGLTVGVDDSKDVHPAPSSVPKPAVPIPSTTEPDTKDVPVPLPEKRPCRPPVAPRAKSFSVKDKASAPESPTPLTQAGPTMDLITFNTDATESQPFPSHADSEDTGNDSQGPGKQCSNPPLVPRKPTLIRIPSKSGKLPEGELLDPPPPLPVEKPVSGLPPPVAQKPSITSRTVPAPRVPDSAKAEDSCSPLAGKSIPQRVGKVPPPRPPPLKGAPGRPPPPRPAPCRSSPDSRPKQISHQGPQRKGPALPPRPSPGHPLYNRKTKEELLIDLGRSDSSAAECQAGPAKSPEPSSSTRITVPPIPGSSHLKAPAMGQGLKDTPGLQAEVLHNFTPAGPGELALKVGDHVTMVERVDSDWCRGSCGGASGIFPANQIKVLSSMPSPKSGKTVKPAAAVVSGPRCVARFGFAGEHSDELSLSEGDIVRLLEYVDQEWARGELSGTVGIFPLNFVEIVEDLPAAAAQTPDGEKPDLGGRAPAHEQLLHSNISNLPPEEWAVALYSFSAQTDEDLSFQQGEHILITQHVDSDWCCGRLNGKEGLFPKAFVQIRAGR
ncbi:SH3 domain-containing protein 19-like [Arapaima gigas]